MVSTASMDAKLTTNKSGASDKEDHGAYRDRQFKRNCQSLRCKRQVARAD